MSALMELPPLHPRVKGLVTASGKEDTEYQSRFNWALVSMCQFYLPAEPLSWHLLSVA